MTRTPDRSRALDALATAMTPPVQAVQDALPEAPLTSPALAALASTLDAMHGRMVLLHPGTPSSFAELRTLSYAAALARAASVHGYPRPALELLGAQAGAIPNARTSDPVTAKRAGEEAHLTPRATNHLGRLLVAIWQLGDATSEQAAAMAGIPLTAEYAKRVSVLERLGYVRPWYDGAGDLVVRKGRAGRERQVYVCTDDGRVFAARLVEEVALETYRAERGPSTD